MARRGTQRAGSNDQPSDSRKTKRAPSGKSSPRLQRAHSKGERSLGELRIEGGREFEVSDYKSSAQPHHDARFLTLPTLNVIALVGFAIVATNAVTGYRSDVERNISEVKGNFTTLSQQLFDLRKSMDDRSLQSWQRIEQRLWCKETEDLNRSINWKCGSTSPDR